MVALITQSLLRLTIFLGGLISASANAFAVPSRTLFTRRGQVPVVRGVPGGGGSELVDRSSHNFNTAALSLNRTSRVADAKPPVQITSTSPVCSGGAESLTGYINLDGTRSMFFWYFEASNEPDNAPLVLWLNGGPGSSSLIGLFQENGPCRIKLDTSGFEPNPESWNQNANMLYLDQPIGTGYSYGTTNVTNSLQAAEDLYEVLQLFLADSKFSKFVGRPFGLWTESYGGHFGPVTVDYILKMNSEVSSCETSSRVVIPVKTLGIGNGITSPLAQYPAYMSYATSNPYNQTLASPEVIANVSQLYTKTGGCRDLIVTCQSTSTDADCKAAQKFCNEEVLGPLSLLRDVYDVRLPIGDASQYPPDLIPALTDAKFIEAIGLPAGLNWTESSDEVYMNFMNTGDWMLDSSPQLSRVIDAGVRTTIYAGDADFLVNYQGVEPMVEALTSSVSDLYRNQEFSNWEIDGETAGLYKNAEQLSYVRFFGSGHEVPAYSYGSLGIGRAARVLFLQTLNGQPISNVGETLENSKLLSTNTTSGSGRYRRAISGWGQLGFVWFVVGLVQVW